MTCRLCGHGKVRSRGLCHRCHERHRRAGTLDQVAAPLARVLDGAYVVSEWRWLSSFGIGRDQAARQLGISRDALDKAITRHARTTDPEDLAS